MKNITEEELKTILEQHELWLDSNETEGKCADLSGADLSGADLTDANLYGVNLRCANLTRSNLYGVNLTRADLSGANLTRSNLTDANLTRANLTSADLTDVYLTSAYLYRVDLTDANLTRANLTSANLYSANLTGANLTSADLTCASLYGANLRCANLTSADLTRSNLIGAYLTETILDEKEQFRKGIVVTEPIVGYKKACGGKIITLELPIGAKVFSINNNKRRTNKVKVLDMQGETELSSIHDIDFKYHVGDEIEIEDFDENYNVECGAGIHFFLTRDEAENY